MFDEEKLMAIVASKTSLGNHIMNVLMTPFLIVVVQIIRYRLVILICGVVCLALAVAGKIHLRLPTPNEIKALKPELIAFAWCALILMMFATLLSIVDHFRYFGWQNVGPKRVAVVAGQFAQAILDDDVQRAEKYGSEAIVNNQENFESTVHFLRKEFHESARIVSATTLGTSDFEFFKGIVAYLKDEELEHGQFQVFVPTVSTTGTLSDSFLKTFQIKIIEELGEYKVADAVLVDITKSSIC